MRVRMLPVRRTCLIDSENGGKQSVSAAALPGKRIWKRALLLSAIGAGLSWLPHLYNGRARTVFLSDVLFTIGSVFLVAGIWGVVSK